MNGGSCPYSPPPVFLRCEVSHSPDAPSAAPRSLPCSSGRRGPRPGEAAHLSSPFLISPPMGRLLHNWSTWARKVTLKGSADRVPPKLAISFLPPPLADPGTKGAHPRGRERGDAAFAVAPPHLQGAGLPARAAGCAGRGGGGAGGAREGPATVAAAAAAPALAAWLGPGSVGAAPRASSPAAAAAVAAAARRTGTRPPPPGAPTQRAPPAGMRSRAPARPHPRPPPARRAQA